MIGVRAVLGPGRDHVDSVELGEAPNWEDVIFALGVASVALIGVEAASGLAGEMRVGRRGLRRVVLVSIAAALVLFVLRVGRRR